jgi:hypothetical protein
VIPDVLSPARLAELRAMIDGAMDGTVRPDKVADADFQIQWEPSVKDKPGVARRDKIRVIFHLCHTHSFFWDLATSDAMLDRVENLIGPDIKLYTDQMFCKPARHGSEVPWHHDSAYWPDAEPGLLSCWLAIDDVTIENGCVRFIPGSHKNYVPHHEIVTDNPNNVTVQPGTVDAAKEVPVEIKAGSMSVHHSLCVHRSLPNMSDRPRRGLVMIYLPADLKFVRPWNFKYGFKQVRGPRAVAYLKSNSEQFNAAVLSRLEVGMTRKLLLVVAGVGAAALSLMLIGPACKQQQPTSSSSSPKSPNVIRAGAAANWWAPGRAAEGGAAVAGAGAESGIVEGRLGRVHGRAGFSSSAPSVLTAGPKNPLVLDGQTRYAGAHEIRARVRMRTDAMPGPAFHLYIGRPTRFQRPRHRSGSPWEPPAGRRT